MPELYGIKETDLVFYLLFGVTVIPFSLVMDMFLLNAQELLHGWKLYDYVHYQNYRFTVREVRWLMNTETVDESIAQELQTVDMMCFSPQFYFVTALHAYGIIFGMFGGVSMPMHTRTHVRVVRTQTHAAVSRCHPAPD